MASATVPRDTDPFVVRALTRGLSILGLFDVDHREWTIDEMAEQTGLVRMTAYRMVRTLESMAFLVRDPSDQPLPPRSGDHRHVLRRRRPLRRSVEAARPFLESLVQETGESVTLAVEVDGLPGLRGHHQHHPAVQAQTAPGRILGDIATVHGKIFAAFKSPRGEGGHPRRAPPPADSPHRHRPRCPRGGARPRVVRRTWPTTSRGSTSASARWEPRCATSSGRSWPPISVVGPARALRSGRERLLHEGRQRRRPLPSPPTWVGPRATGIVVWVLCSCS